MKTGFLCLMLSFSVVVISLSACSNYKNRSLLPAQDENAKQVMETRVDCRTAQQDIALLEEEKVSVGKRILTGAQRIMPITAAAKLVMGDYTDGVEVASGEYNEKLEMKIKQIKRTCGFAG